MKNNDNITIEEAIEKFGNPYWRINNLYTIVDKQGQRVKFKLNWAQEDLYQNMWYCNTILKARQLGISTFVCLLFLDRCLFNPNMSAGVIAHTREDAEALFKRIKLTYDSLPEEIKELRPATTDSARELVFNNGSSIRVGTSMRGSTLQYLLISEFGKICAKFPEKAQEIITGSLNTIAHGQYTFIESTAEGREGYFYDICKSAQDLQKSGKKLSKLDYKFHFFPWTGERKYRTASIFPIPADIITYFEGLERLGINLDDEQKYWYVAKLSTQGENMKREYPTTPDEAWEQSTEGTYYAKQISQARAEHRIGFVRHDAQLPVYTSWDLGYNDLTSIIYFQVYGKEIRIIDFDSGDGESLSHWLGIVKSKPYIYEKHLAPHDIMVHEYSTGTTRLSMARQMGFNLSVVPKTDLMVGIDQVRNILNRCWFDESKCSNLIKALENYKKEWDDNRVCWREKPHHNWASHPADAMRNLCLGLNLTEKRYDPQEEMRLNREYQRNKYTTRFP
jgi:hypothetical protein